MPPLYYTISTPNCLLLQRQPSQGMTTEAREKYVNKISVRGKIPSIYDLLTTLII